MKPLDVKRKVMKETVLVAVVMALLIAAAAWLQSVYDNHEQENTGLEGQVASVNNSLQLLRGKYSKVQQNADLYKEILKKSAQEGLSLNRQLISKRFNQFKSQYYLSNLHLTMSPVEEMKGPAYKHETSVMIASEVAADFGVLSDEDAFNLITAISQELPGSVRFTRFTLTRAKKVTQQDLHSITTGGVADMVKGQIKFLWMGIQPIEPSLTTDSDAKKKR